MPKISWPGSPHFDNVLHGKSFSNIKCENKAKPLFPGLLAAGMQSCDLGCTKQNGSCKALLGTEGCRHRGSVSVRASVALRITGDLLIHQLTIVSLCESLGKLSLKPTSWPFYDSENSVPQYPFLHKPATSDSVVFLKISWPIHSYHPQQCTWNFLSHNTLSSYMIFCRSLVHEVDSKWSCPNIVWPSCPSPF